MLGPRVLSSVVVVLVGVVPALFGVWGVAASFAVFGIIALIELTAMFERLDYTILVQITAPVLIVTVIVVAAGWPLWVFSGLTVVTLIGPALFLIVRPTLDGTLPAWIGTCFATLYLVVPLGHIVAVRHIGGVTTGAGGWLTNLEDALGFRSSALGLAWFLLALVTTWLTDVAAYATGKTIGKHKMTPVLSPHKTWEGFGGSIVGAVIVTTLANWLFGIGMRIEVAVLAGVLLAFVATAGDLAESLLKRQTGVKDTGTLIPGHGGVLDRLDSQFFVFIAVYYVALAVG